ncbi:MAG: 2-amino-4-hydroxy-6-hydroxymethyldihydropteridine diphosphokinase [Chloroflexi bacterium]|nr:2-amino-4-hydroxy-6-hydroxymethyldihydropteridine diphosphokinase [Chloroflexota bacterium]
MSEKDKPEHKKVYLGLGSNLGNRENNLLGAMDYLRYMVKIDVISSPYETKPEGYKDQALFLNAVILGDTELNPWQLLVFIKKAEKEMGRIPTFVNGPRKIDIDILFYGDQIIDSDNLVIPHPGIAERTFVLVPLVEIDAGYVHPVLNKTVKDLLAGIRNPSPVIKREWKSRKS